MRDPVETNEDRYRALFREAARPVLAFVLRRTDDPADAADIVADTFLVAWRRIDDVPPGDEARLWLFGTARGVMRNHARGKVRRTRLGERLRAELESLAVADPAIAVTEVDAVRAALARLDELDGELLRLTAWEGLAPSELAVVLDIPAGTARTRLHRARARLRAELGERNVDDGHVPAGERVLAHDPRCQ
ncbi:MAG TPA: RNA polymerase sigma factor [Acidimicrobiales bacterium]